MLSFQFTRPVWGATRSLHPALPVRDYFNLCAPCGALQQCLTHKKFWIGYFNLCAPCGALQSRAKVRWLRDVFQFMRPVWGATG